MYQTDWSVHTQSNGTFIVDGLDAAQPWPTIRQGEISTFTCWFETKGGGTSSLLVSSGETYTIESGETEVYSETTISSDGTLTQENDSTLTTSGNETLADAYPNFQGLKPYLDFADAAAYGLDVNNLPWYREQLPNRAAVDSLVLGIEPNTDLREQTIDGVWGIVVGGTDERNLALSNWRLTVDVFVLGRYEAFADRDEVQAKLEAAGIQTMATTIEVTTIDDTDSPYLTQGEDRIQVDTTNGAVTVTLSSADAGSENEVTIVDIGGNAGTNNITIDTEGSEVINPNGDSSKTIATNWGQVEILADGSNWFADIGGDGAPADATYLTETSDGTLTAEVPIGAVDGAMSPTSGEVLGWDGSQWTNRTDQTASGGSDLADLASGLIVYIGDTTGRQSLDPGTTNAPIFDAIEAIYANNEGGVVYLPPGNINHVGGSTPSGRSQGWLMRPGISVVGFGGQNPNQFATKVTRTSAGDLAGWGTDSNESNVTTGANMSGLVIDMDYQNLSNATGRGLVYDNANTGTYNCWMRDMRIDNVGDKAVDCQGDLFASTFGPNFTIRRADPENAGAGTAIFDDVGGGVGCVIAGSNEMYGHTSPASGSSSNMLGMRLGGGWHIDDMRFGGAISQVLQHSGRELSAGHLYWEPNPNGTPSEPWAYQFDEGATTSGGGGVSIHDMTIGGGGVTLDDIVQLQGFTDGVHGPIQLPYIADRSSNTVNNQQIEIEVDLTPGCIYGGPASEVDNASGAVLTNPMVCLGDVTKKFSQGVGFDGGTEDSQL